MTAKDFQDASNFLSIDGHSLDADDADRIANGLRFISAQLAAGMKMRWVRSERENVRLSRFNR